MPALKFEHYLPHDTWIELLTGEEAAQLMARDEVDWVCVSFCDSLGFFFHHASLTQLACTRTHARTHTRTHTHAHARIHARTQIGPLSAEQKVAGQVADVLTRSDVESRLEACEIVAFVVFNTEQEFETARNELVEKLRALALPSMSDAKRAAKDLRPAIRGRRPVRQPPSHGPRRH